ARIHIVHQPRRQVIIAHLRRLLVPGCSLFGIDQARLHPPTAVQLFSALSVICANGSPGGGSGLTLFLNLAVMAVLVLLAASTRAGIVATRLVPDVGAGRLRRAFPDGLRANVGRPIAAYRA